MALAVSSTRPVIAFASVQTSPAFGQRDENLDRTEALLEGLEADLVVLPELFAAGYAFRDAAEMRDLGEPGVR